MPDEYEAAAAEALRFHREGNGLPIEVFKRLYRVCKETGKPITWQFLQTYGVKPERPEGWESCLNLHGEARCDLLRAMGLEDDAKEEYHRQLEVEKKIK